MFVWSKVMSFCFCSSSKLKRELVWYPLSRFFLWFKCETFRNLSETPGFRIEDLECHCFVFLLWLAAENETHEGKRKCEALWPIFKISHQKSRYIYDLFYRRKAISRELFDFCLDQGHADKNLIAKWKKVSTSYLDEFTLSLTYLQYLCCTRDLFSISKWRLCCCPEVCTCFHVALDNLPKRSRLNC